MLVPPGTSMTLSWNLQYCSCKPTTDSGIHAHFLSLWRLTVKDDKPAREGSTSVAET
jgi:hypothetical protein